MVVSTAFPPPCTLTIPELDFVHYVAKQSV